jgi:hypothetical protein
MSQDDYGIDLESVYYPPKTERIICAAEERHADHEARIAALELQVHRLLNAEPHVPEADWAHIPAAEWEAICEELEGLRGTRPTMDSDGVLVSHDAWDAMCANAVAYSVLNAEVEALRHRKDVEEAGDYVNVPAAKWRSINAELEGLRKFKAAHQ